jgi:broad specificity phosphatase PhoE
MVRHGQASFFADDYDNLSALGREQARLLGVYWARCGRTFDEVYCGPRARQRQTAELAGAACREAGVAWPEITVLPELDEYDLNGILYHLAPELARQNAAFAELIESCRQGGEEDERVRRFQKMFEVLMLHWMEAAGEAPGRESWPAFRERVRRGIHKVVDPPGKGRRVVFFTSGGFISRAVQWALGAPDRTALELNWRLRNGSLTEFVFTRNRFTLDSFNELPYLEDEALRTYR